MRLLHVHSTSKYLKLNFEDEERSKPTINAIVDYGKTETACARVSE